MSRTESKTRFDGEKKPCSCCGALYLASSGKQRLCERCGKICSKERDKIRARAEQGSIDPFHAYIKCVDCGRVVRKTGHTQRRCRDCAAERNNELAKESYRRKKAGLPPRREPKAPEVIPLPEPPAEDKRLYDWHDLSGKSADRISAEAAAFGFGASYGKYVAAVQFGQIDRWLADKGITDPEAVLRGIKVK